MVNPAAIKSAAEKSGAGKKATQSSSGKRLFNQEKSPYIPSHNFNNNLEEGESNPEGPQDNTDSFLNNSSRGNWSTNVSGPGSKNQRGINNKSKGKGKFSAKNLKSLLPLLLIGGFLGIPLLIGLLAMEPKHLLEQGIDVAQPDAKIVEDETQELAVEMLNNGSLPSTFADRLTDTGLEIGYLDTSNNFIAGLHPNPDTSIALASKVNSEATPNNSLVVRFKNHILTAAEFGAALEYDPEVYAAFSEASYGLAASNFDEAAQSFYSNINSSRNVFANYTVSSDSKKDLENFRKVLSDHFKNGTSTVFGAYDEDAGNSRNNTDPKYTAARDYITNAIDTGKTKDGEQSTLSNAAVLINSAINASETYQSMQYFLIISEALSKAVAGESSTTPVNSVMNYLTTSSTDANGNTGSATQSPGLSSMLSGSYSSNLATKTKSYSLDRVIDTASDAIASIFGNTVASNTTVTTNSLNTALDNFGTSQATDSSSFVKSYSYSVVKGSTTLSQDAVEAFIAAITPSISQSVLFNNVGETLSGIAAGEFYVKGAAAFGTHKAQFTSGGTIGDSSSIIAYNNYIESKSDIKAAADRIGRSPFDISSPNTFLGSIFSNLQTSLLTSPSFSSIVSSFSTLANNSLLSLLPGASAANSANSYYTTFGNCPNLEKIGAKGDIYCNPIITFDVETLQTAINDPDFEKFLSKNLIAKTTTSNSNQNSINLASSKTITIPAEDSYITDHLNYVADRSSTFGIQDTNIYSSIVAENPSNGGFLEFLKKILNSIKNLFSNAGESWEIKKKAKNIAENKGKDAVKLATGEEFLNSTSNPNWQNHAYAQKYIITERILSQMGYFSTENTNTASVSAYFTPGTGNNPVNTYLANIAEGHKNETDSEYLARISGCSKDEADFILGFFAYNSYLASIDYENRLTFGQEPKIESKIFVEPLEIKPESTTIALNFNQKREYYYAA